MSQSRKVDDDLGETKVLVNYSVKYSGLSCLLSEVQVTGLHNDNDRPLSVLISAPAQALLLQQAQPVTGQSTYAGPEPGHVSEDIHPADSKEESPQSIPSLVSSAKRIAQVAIACIYCLFASGVVFGYAALKPVLVSEGVYRDLCTASDPGSNDRPCYEQEIRLNLMFTVAAVVTNVAALPVGSILDKYGPKVCSLLGCVSLALGSVFLVAAKGLPFDGYLPGYVFLALGGPGIFISTFHLSNTFPRYSGLILALLTGAFDTSSAVFLVYRLIYTSTDHGFELEKFFLLYLIVPILIALIQVLVMPRQSYKTIGEVREFIEHEAESIDPNLFPRDEVPEFTQPRPFEDVLRSDEQTPLLDKAKDRESRAKEKERRKQALSGVWGALHGKSALEQIKSPFFIFITLFVIVQMTRINYFVATIRSQYEYLLGDLWKARRVNEWFDLALPLGGVLSIPFIGTILDNTSTTVCLSVLVGTATLIGGLGVISTPWAAYLNVALFVIYRPLYYTAVSDYSAKVFGSETFGKVYGLIICVSGLFNLSQTGLDALTHIVFDNDPVPVNVALMVLVFAIGCALVGYVYRQSRVMAAEETEAARE